MGLPIYFNGKFAAQRTTGVQRVARRLILALDERLSPADGRWVLLLPADAPAPALRHIEVRKIGWRGLPLHLWEQTVLPIAARDGLLVNLAGAAPWLARRQAALLHDAAPFDRPQAYTALFGWWYRALFRHLARRGHGLLTASAFSRGRLAPRLGMPASHIGLLPGGSDHLDHIVADAGVLARLGLEGRRYLLAVGSANPNKNLAALVRAFVRLKMYPDLRLVIVGGSSPGVFAVGADLDAPGVVQAGAVDDAALKALYQRADALVFPSLYEGFGLPPLEAMACGCPVAASHAASIPEVCGDAALYFDPASVDDIAAALHRLLSDQPLRDALRRAGTARAATYRWDASARSLQAALAAGLSR
jgi:glycosyltransferase involved in cell wall biosynthesis